MIDQIHSFAPAETVKAKVRVNELHSRETTPTSKIHKITYVFQYSAGVGLVQEWADYRPQHLFKSLLGGNCSH